MDCEMALSVRAFPPPQLLEVSNGGGIVRKQSHSETPNLVPKGKQGPFDRQELPVVYREQTFGGGPQARSLAPL